MSEAETPSKPRPGAAPPYTPGSRRVLGAVANIFAPGSGQLLQGRRLRALLVFAGFGAGMALLPHWPYAFFFSGAVWVAAIIDSGITRPIRYPTTSRCVGIIVLTFFGVFMVRSMVMRYYAEAFNVGHNDMAPTIRRGDVIVAAKADLGAVGQPVVTPTRARRASTGSAASSPVAAIPSRFVAASCTSTATRFRMARPAASAPSTCRGRPVAGSSRAASG